MKTRRTPWRARSLERACLFMVLMLTGERIAYASCWLNDRQAAR